MSKDQKTSSQIIPNQNTQQQEPRQAGMDSTVSNVVSFLSNVPKQSIVYRFLVMVASVVVVSYGISAANKIIAPICLALFLTIILLVPLHWLQKKGCPKIISLIIVIAFTIIVFVGISYNVAKSLNYLVAASPEYRAKLEAKIKSIDQRLEKIGIAISGLTAWRQSIENDKNNENENEVENEDENIDNHKENAPNTPAPPDTNPQNTKPITAPTSKSENQPTRIERADTTDKVDKSAVNQTGNGIVDPKLNNTSAAIAVDVLSKETKSIVPSSGNSETLAVDGDTNENHGNTDGDGGGVVVADKAEIEGDEAITDAKGAVGEVGNIETTSLSEFLGSGRLGRDFLGADNSKILQDNLRRTTRNDKSKEKSQLILLKSQDVMLWLGTSLIAIRQIGESAFLVLIFTIFMIFEASRFPAKVDRAFGFDGPINNHHLQCIAGEIRRYLFLKAISSMMSAVAATAVYWFFGVPAMFFWGLVAFFLYFIPNVGGILASIIPGLLIFMTHDWQGLVAYAVCLVAIECTIGYGIEPKMLGHGLGISTVVILISLFTWGMLLGPIGLFLAAPLTIMVKITLQAFKETEWIATMIDRT
ncbi:MAG: AI-2E family transporter [Planctomycetaceae bacterium]|jgi:predicted PurR-regulated permease PerM|nr:AI-2E family transporter [Planctomycetaceae bacterium]